MPICLSSLSGEIETTATAAHLLACLFSLFSMLTCVRDELLLAVLFVEHSEEPGRRLFRNARVNIICMRTLDKVLDTFGRHMYCIPFDMRSHVCLFS